jgi:hypothetical protein
MVGSGIVFLFLQPTIREATVIALFGLIKIAQNPFGMNHI